MSAPAASRRPSVLARWGMIGLLAVGIASHNSIAAWQESHSFMINASESLPNWAFFVRAGKEPVKGDYVFFLSRPLVISSTATSDRIRARSASK